MGEGDGKDLFESGALSMRDRLEACSPLTYWCLFDDGYVDACCEDELLISADFFDNQLPQCDPQMRDAAGNMWTPGQPFPKNAEARKEIANVDLSAAGRRPEAPQKAYRKFGR
ncbi:MAG: hypothetical protein KAH44_12470 [Oricola sp.]|nr:hypothetical protein [Oricola sp.]